MMGRRHVLLASITCREFPFMPSNFPVKPSSRIQIWEETLYLSCIRLALKRSNQSKETSGSSYKIKREGSSMCVTLSVTI